MSKSIPARWLPYKAIGNCIPGTRFLTFKVPLKDEVCRGLPEEKRFTLRHLVEKVSQLGLVIDLTNTNRYYNCGDLQRWDINYCKIYVEGHRVPSHTVVQKFFDAVDDYLTKNPDNGKLIGVHCTHGLNRTGYLVCRYLVDKLGLTSDEAIKVFNEARGHPIERHVYLDALKLDSKSAEKLIPAEKSDSHHSKSKSRSDRSGSSSHNSTSDKRHRRSHHSTKPYDNSSRMTPRYFHEGSNWQGSGRSHWSDNSSRSHGNYRDQTSWNGSHSYSYNNFQEFPQSRHHHQGTWSNQSRNHSYSRSQHSGEYSHHNSFDDPRSNNANCNYNHYDYGGRGQYYNRLDRARRSDRNDYRPRKY